MGPTSGLVTMESDLREQADMLVNRLVSEPGSERQRILEEQDTTGWDAVHRQALRDALRAARLRGRITDAAYEETRVQVERWYAHHDAHEDVDPVHIRHDAPTVELGHAAPSRVEMPRDRHSPSVPANSRPLRVVPPDSSRAEEPPLLRYPPQQGVDRLEPVMLAPDVEATNVAPLDATRELGPDATRELMPDATRELMADATRELMPDATRELPSPPPPLLREPPVVAAPRPDSIKARADVQPRLDPDIRPRPDPLRTDVSMPDRLKRRIEPKLDAVHRSAAPPAAPPAAAPKAPARETAAAPAQPSTPVGPQFVPGAIIRGRYVVEEQIGAGGSALIFRARDMRRAALEGDGQVALKVPREHLREREDIAARLKREFHQAQSITHPNVVRVFDIDCEQGTWFLTMELLDGESLATVLSCLHPKRLPSREALAIVLACGEALAHAHERGVLHGDFKPGNVFVTRNEQVFVLDFGVVEPSPLPRDADPAARPTSRASAATPCYASPDILSGESPDERDDVFSLGCVVYEVMTGRHPFDRHSTLEARDRRMRVRRSAGLSRRQYAAVERALSWQRRRRWGSVREFLTEFGVYRPGRSAWWHATAAALLGAVAAAALLSWHHTIESKKAPGTTASNAAATPERSGAIDRAPPSSDAARTPTAVALPPQTLPSSKARTTPAAQLPQATPAPRDTAAPAKRVAAPQKTAARAPVTAQKGSTTRVFALADESAPSTRRASAVPAAASPRAAAKPGRVSFEQANLIVNERAVSAVVRVRRLEDLRGRVRIQWRAIPGEATPSKDYSFDGIGTIDIPEGQDLRVLYIPILNDDIREGNESFDVELFAVTGRAELGPISRATITILDDD